MIERTVIIQFSWIQFFVIYMESQQLQSHNNNNNNNNNNGKNDDGDDADKDNDVKLRCT
jgi:hypothetical protein